MNMYVHIYVYIYVYIYMCIQVHKGQSTKKQLCSLYVMCLDWAVSFQDPNKLQRLIHFAAKLHVSENINIEQASHIYIYICTDLCFFTVVLFYMTFLVLFTY